MCGAGASVGEDLGASVVTPRSSFLLFPVFSERHCQNSYCKYLVLCRCGTFLFCGLCGIWEVSACFGLPNLVTPRAMFILIQFCDCLN